jgi:hypothetical protein
MSDAMTAPWGERLALESYLEDFDQRFWEIGEEGFWKLERQQTFKEPGVESWEAFARGDWEQSLRLIAEQRNHYSSYFAKIAAHDFSLHRVRIVEEPVSPYLQWELHLLNLKAECGERTRVIGPERVSSLESDRPLPELVVLGDSTVYEIQYDNDGILEGAIRFTEGEVIEAKAKLIKRLFAEAEGLETFFRRKILPLGPPNVGG